MEASVNWQVDCSSDRTAEKLKAREAREENFYGIHFLMGQGLFRAHFNKWEGPGRGLSL